MKFNYFPNLYFSYFPKCNLIFRFQIGAIYLVPTMKFNYFPKFNLISWTLNLRVHVLCFST